MKKKYLWVSAIIFGLLGLVTSCQIGDNALGSDILPPGDNVAVSLDTIFEIDAYPVTGQRKLTSELGDLNATNRLLLLGSIQDTIFGKSTASLVTQFNTSSVYLPAANTEIDSLFLVLYMTDFFGDEDQDLTLSVYEFTERIFIDSIYYSDYDIAGKYDPLPLVQKTITPEAGTAYELLIEDQDFIDKFLAIESDTAIYYSDSIFKDYFNGFYITAEPTAEEGTMARVLINNTLSRLSMKYANDSTDVDSTVERDFYYAHFSINEFSSQKINIFEHDYSGTRLEEIIDNESVSTPYSYVQGMSGVNTRFSFANLSEWMDQNPIIINSARLVFDVVPEEESGILYDDLPSRMMFGTILEDDSYEPIFDYNVILGNDQTQLASEFGGFRKGESDGLFSDTTYTYQFKMSLHFQSMIDGAKPDNDFILQLYDGLISPKNIKFWSNLPANQKRIRLEIVYLEL